MDLTFTLRLKREIRSRIAAIKSNIALIEVSRETLSNLKVMKCQAEQEVGKVENGLKALNKMKEHLEGRKRQKIKEYDEFYEDLTSVSKSRSFCGLLYV